ncbi:SPOR domain-containing protein [Sphingobium sp. AN641]|uniref:SPOR domain-containing protein n=1 Tax=Sphingobium sp. AN641 TaxID=3133443 RepID=UPI0030C3E11B
MAGRWAHLLLVGLATVATPALADVKAGVDAWQQGDYARAISEWRPLAAAGDPDAQFNMGQAHKLGRGVQTDLSAALEWYRKAAGQGHLRAEDNLGLLMFQQGDRAGAMPYLQRSAARGEPRAQYIVGTSLFNGDLVGKDWVRAYAFMTRASASGLPQATTSLQQMDKFVPEAQRRQGLALAADLERQSKAGALATGPAPKPQGPVVRPAPSSVRTTSLPPSDLNRPLAEPVAQPRTAPPPVREATKPAPRAVAAIPAPAKGGAYRIQLGAFGEEANARALWSRLTARVSGLSAYQPFLVKGGNVTRLQAGPLGNAADAGRLCASIKAAGADCLLKKM